ncbi:AAA family ATPase [Enterobacter sp. BRE11]|nr:AAA family ATPase [Enterobacter sp. BRE11]
MTTFLVVERARADYSKYKDLILLNFSTWNDYSFRTLFDVTYIGKDGAASSIGQIKIGFVGQDESITTLSRMDEFFRQIGDDFFSIASSPDFYQNLYAFGRDFGDNVLKSLNCVLIEESALTKARPEIVFTKSLLRNVHLKTLKDQLNRIRQGYSPLTNFYFAFKRNAEKHAKLSLEFAVEAESLPPTNIHALIGRNGLGKTTILNGMVDSIMKEADRSSGVFVDTFGRRLGEGYFSSVVSIAFSAFDPFKNTLQSDGNDNGFSYHYIGLKGSTENKIFQNGYLEELFTKCSDSVYECLSDNFKKKLWLEAMDEMGSDENFKNLDVVNLARIKPNLVIHECKWMLRKMSSGHAIAFITLSMLIDKIQEKSLVLFDEPESHLHPPLLSTLIRVMSDLLYKRNGVAIIATHSPVVVQEVPKSCCWILDRYVDFIDSYRPSLETFAENVGVITKEVFKLEMEKSGYHNLLKKQVSTGLSYEMILNKFDGQLGFEGRAVLLSMVLLRDKKIKDLLS